VSNADNFKNCPYDNSHDALLLGILTSFVLGWQTVERIISMNTEGAACLFQLPSMEEWFPLRDSQIELLPLRECNFVRWKSSLPAYAKGIQSILERGFRSLTVLMHDKEQAIQYWREFSTKYDCWSVHERHYDYYEEQRSILARLYDCLVA
jgi:hypothetical protein